MTSALAASALDFALRSHGRQRRDSDGAPFIAHPVEVARLLRDSGCSEELVAAGLLHDVLEDTAVQFEELKRRFGSAVAELVEAVSEDAAIGGYRGRKLALREQVRAAGRDAALLFAADKVSKVRELRERAIGTKAAPRPGGETAESDRLRLDHYRESLAMLRDVAGDHPLVARLATELGGCVRAIEAQRRLQPDAA